MGNLPTISIIIAWGWMLVAGIDAMLTEWEMRE
jgi:hypothetical protein